MTEQSHDRQNEATRCCNHAGLLASFRHVMRFTPLPTEVRAPVSRESIETQTPHPTPSGEGSACTGVTKRTQKTLQPHHSTNWDPEVSPIRTDSNGAVCPD
jgi:hypothetical protein